MKQSINKYAFIDAFNEIRPDNFSYEGLKALYEYLTEFEDESGGELELDVIAFCCEFTEYANIDEYLREYRSDLLQDYDDPEEYKEAIMDEIRDKTACIPVDENAFIIQCY